MGRGLAVEPCTAKKNCHLVAVCLSTCLQYLHLGSDLYTRAPSVWCGTHSILVAIPTRSSTIATLTTRKLRKCARWSFWVFVLLWVSRRSLSTLLVHHVVGGLRQASCMCEKGQGRPLGALAKAKTQGKQ